MTGVAYMVGEEDQGLFLRHLAWVFQRDGCSLLVVDLDVDTVCLAECLDLQVITVCARLRHFVQVGIEAAINLLF